MKKALLIVSVAVSVAVFGLSFGCGSKDAKDKPAATVAADTVADTVDTAAVAGDTVAAVPDATAFAPDTDTTFTDKRDGKVYRIVEADGQFWMAENLNYEAVGSVCYDNKALNCAKYGRLYDEHTAANEACPDGWHLPLGAEWTALENYASGSGMAGKKLKSTSGWKNKGNGTDEYGFSALPGGYGFSGGRFDGKFYFAGSSGFWWGKEDGKYRFASILRRMDFDKDGVDGDIGPKKTLLYYVRCVQDSKEGER